MDEALNFPEYESYLDAEAEARRRTVLHVVVEIRDEDDPPGVEAVFAVCPADQIDDVPRGREVVFTAEIPCASVAILRVAIEDSLRWVDQATRRQGEPVELLAAIRSSLIAGLDKAASTTGAPSG